MTATYTTLNTDTRDTSTHNSLRAARREAACQGFRFAGEAYECPHGGGRVLPLYRSRAAAAAFDDFAPAVLLTAAP